MPRAHLGQTSLAFEAPLTVTAVSMRLGVSASTLRTWERRYGLGPEERRAGSHRRYLPADVARLTRMVDLVHQGVSAADAAASVLAASPLNEPPVEAPVPHCVQDLVDATRAARPQELRDRLSAAIAEGGLVRTWSRLVSPALDRLRGHSCGETPGCAPSILLHSAFLEVLGAIAEQPEERPVLASVVVLSDSAHELAAHVVGVALLWYGIDVRVVTTARIGEEGGVERYRAHVAERPVDLAIIMGRGAGCEALIRAIAQETGDDVLLVGADAPPVVDPNVVRVRTLAACVEEALEMLVPGVDLTAIGG